MGILDWFKNRAGQFDPDRASDELVRWAVEKAITLTNPRLKLLANCHQRLTPAVETTIAFLRAQVQALPPVRPVSSTVWSSDPALRAFFVAPSDIPTVLGRSDNLRLLQQHGPGLGSMFGEAPAAPSEQARLEAELLENERQLVAIGGGESALEAELECLKAVLENPQRCLRIEPRRLRLSPMNLVLEENSTDPAASVDFALAHLSGSPPMRRAFVLARVARTELPSVQKINFDEATRYL